MNTKITVGIPCNRTIKPKTMACLLEVIARGGYDFHFVVAVDGYTIAENRTFIAVKALNNQSDFLLFIDDDMIFPPETLDHLLKQDKDIIGLPYRGRTLESKRIIPLPGGETVDLDEPHDEKYDSTFECTAKGTGVMLIKTDVFRMARPWFDFVMDETGGCKMGEDYFFCSKARKHGFSVWCDPTLTISHLGDYEY